MEHFKLPARINPCVLLIVKSVDLFKTWTGKNVVVLSPLWKGTHLYGVLMQQFLMIEINIFCS